MNSPHEEDNNSAPMNISPYYKLYHPYCFNKKCNPAPFIYAPCGLYNSLTLPCNKLRHNSFLNTDNPISLRLLRQPHPCPKNSHTAAPLQQPYPLAPTNSHTAAPYKQPYHSAPTNSHTAAPYNNHTAAPYKQPYRCPLQTAIPLCPYKQPYRCPLQQPYPPPYKQPYRSAPTNSHTARPYKQPYPLAPYKQPYRPPPTTALSSLYDSPYLLKRSKHFYSFLHCFQPPT